jgi:hypothetical protein
MQKKPTRMDLAITDRAVVHVVPEHRRGLRIG